MSSMNSDLSPSYLVVSGPLRRDEARTRSSLMEDRHRAKTDSPKNINNIDFLRENSNCKMLCKKIGETLFTF